MQQSQMPNVYRTEEAAKSTEEPTKAQVPKRYPTRVCSKTKRLIEEMQLVRCKRTEVMFVFLHLV